MIYKEIEDNAYYSIFYKKEKVLIFALFRQNKFWTLLYMIFALN